MIRAGSKFDVFFCSYRLSDTSRNTSRVHKDFVYIIYSESNSQGDRFTIIGLARRQIRNSYPRAKRSIPNRKLSIRAGEYRGESIGRASRLKFASDSPDYEISRETRSSAANFSLTLHGNYETWFFISFSDPNFGKLNFLNSFRNKIASFLSKLREREYLAKTLMRVPCGEKIAGSNKLRMLVSLTTL